MAIRYSSNYSRWSDSAYIPSDDATKEEKLHQKRLLEEQQNEEFEKANTAWCEQIKGDMKKREEGIKEKEKSAISLRLKGNKLFQRKKYADALVKYFEALEKTPFALNILTNIALVYEKLNHWEQSIEYCSRAIHINKTCTKALFLRHKALLQLDDNQGALGDLNKCVAFDPDNEVFSHAQTKLSLKLHNDRLQSEVVAIINSNTNNFRSSSAPIVSSSMSCVPNLTLENIRFIVTSEKDDSDHSSMIKKQCQYVDQCMDTLQYYGLNFKACDIFPALSLQPHLTICKVFVLEKLCKCSYACAYMRVAGYMSGLFQRLACFCRSYEEGLISEEKENLEKKREIIELISMLVYVMKSDVATRSFVADVSLL
jgi:tetratricopeptide (TPR) repeat protein